MLEVVSYENVVDVGGSVVNVGEFGVREVGLEWIVFCIGVGGE